VSRARSPRPAAAFTLAEVAVTIAVVGLALVWMLQALNTAKVTAAQTRNLKLARELALYTLGQIEGGLYEEEISDERIEGTYAEEGYPDFYFEAVIGDANFRPSENDPTFDNWLEERRQAELESDEEEVEQPYEKVQIRVQFPPIQDLKSELVIERWLPWNQIHPPEESEEEPQESGAPGNTGGSQ
jgi:hypothetical protein